MTREKIELGKWGERKTAEYLMQRGFQILEKNFRTNYGEIDLIAIKENLILFVEVKTRSSDSFGLPEESITLSKKEHLQKSVQAYFLEHPEMEEMNWQIDVAAIRKIGNVENPEIVWFENAVS